MVRCKAAARGCHLRMGRYISSSPPVLLPYDPNALHHCCVPPGIAQPQLWQWRCMHSQPSADLLPDMSCGAVRLPALYLAVGEARISLASLAISTHGQRY